MVQKYKGICLLHLMRKVICNMNYLWNWTFNWGSTTFVLRCIEANENIKRSVSVKIWSIHTYEIYYHTRYQYHIIVIYNQIVLTLVIFVSLNIFISLKQIRSSLYSQQKMEKSNLQSEIYLVITWQCKAPRSCQFLLWEDCEV